jgi:glycerol uptake facilitator-like aquaporin
MKYIQNEDGISLITDIFLFSVIVILAVIFCVIVVGIVNTVPKSRNVAVDVVVDSQNHICVTYMGGVDGAEVEPEVTLTATLNGDAEFPAFTAPIQIGETITTTHTNAPTDHVLVVATFKDGYKQVVLDTLV